MPEIKKENLVRKQFLIYPSQIEKMAALADHQSASMAEIVRQAIDAFSPDSPGDMAESELLELVSMRVKEALDDTRKTREKLDRTLAKLDMRAG
jgi:hypothetical protein